MFIGSEIIQIADLLAKERDLGKAVVLSALESAIEAAAKKKYGHENHIFAKIHPGNGSFTLRREMVVVEKVENRYREIALLDALLLNPSVTLGQTIYEDLPHLDIARVSAQTVRQTLTHKVREAEQQKQYEEFKSRLGDIVSGSVKRIEAGGLVVDLGRGEAFLPNRNTIRSESFKINDRIRACIDSVNQNSKNRVVTLSRISDQFLVKLFEQEVPEIYDKVIEIKAVAREPGSKAKVALFCSDPHVELIGACVGMRGSRIQAIINELHGEKIDLVRWSSDQVKYVIAALAPAQVSKIVVDNDALKVEVVVAQDQLSMAIGRSGQNVRLASKITGWHIDILTEEAESKRRTEEFRVATALFVTELGLEETLAQLLAAEGFASVEDIAYAHESELSDIEGLSAEMTAQLISRAKAITQKKSQKIVQALEALGVDEHVRGFLAQYVSAQDIYRLAQLGVKTLEDLGELSVEEFKKAASDTSLTDEVVRQIIQQ